VIPPIPGSTTTKVSEGNATSFYRDFGLKIGSKRSLGNELAKVPPTKEIKRRQVWNIELWPLNLQETHANPTLHACT